MDIWNPKTRKWDRKDSNTFGPDTSSWNPRKKQWEGAEAKTENASAQTNLQNVQQANTQNTTNTNNQLPTEIVQSKFGTYEEFAEKNKEKVPGAMSDELYEKMMRDLYNGMVHQETQRQQSGSNYYGLTNENYQKYLDNIQKNATEQNQKNWLEEQKRNLEALRGNKEVYEAVRAWNSARWNPLEYMQKNDAENVLEKYGFDKEAIKSLADTYRREENASFSQTMMEDADKTTDSGLAGKVVGHIRSIGANMASIFAVPQGWANAINEKITGEYDPVDTNSFWHMSGDYRDRVRQNNTNDITGVEEYEEKGKDIPGYRKALGMAYQAGSSVADNLLTAGAFGPEAALAIMGSQAAQSTMKDTFERTGDNTKSALTGTAAGLIEAATEKASLDHFWDMAKGTGKALTRSMLVNFLMQSGIEGTEEMTSEALNTLVDRWINQKDSNYELNVQNYMNQGYSEEEARDMALNDVWKQMKEAGKVGAMAGGMGGGVAIGANKLGQYSTGANAVQSGQIEQIVAQAQTYEDKRVQKALKEYQENPSDMKAGKLMYEMYAVDEITRNQAEKKDKGNLLQRITKNRKKGQNSQPQSVTEDTQMQSNEQKPRMDVENAIVRMSEAQNAEELSDVMHEVEDNGTPEQIQEARSYYEMRGAQMVVEGKTTNEELAFAGMQMSEAKAYEAGSKNEEVAPEKLSLKGKIAYNEGQQSYLKEQVRKNTITDTKGVSGAKATDNTGKELVIQDIVSVGAEPVVQTKDGNVNLKDISFQNEAVGVLYNNASTLGSKKAAQAYIKNYPGNIMVNAYESMVQSIMKDGELGLDIDKVLKRRSKEAYWIGEDGVKEFYALGQEKAKESNRQLETVKRKGKGQLKDKRRGKTEEPLMKVLEQIAKRTGLDIEVSDKEVSEVRGYFEESLSRIVLNADANMFETVFHELGEFTDSWNTEGMRKFQTALLDWYFETHDNDKMQNLIESVQNIYKQQEGSKTYREAANEIVNDAISGLFATETGAKDFTEWLGKNRTETETKSILQTVADFLKDLCDVMRTYITGHNLSGTTRTTMEMNEKRAKELRQQFLNAMDKAVENYQKAEKGKVSKNEETHFSLRNVNIAPDTEIQFIVHEDYTNVAVNDYKELNKLQDKVRKIPRGTYENKSTGYSADINATTINKILNPAPKFNPWKFNYIENLNAVLHLPKLFENAVYVDTKAPQKTKNAGKQITGYHHFVAPIEMNHGDYRVMITAREKVNSNTLYVVKTEILPQQKRGAQVAGQMPPNSVGTPRTIKIPDLITGVKIYDYDMQQNQVYSLSDLRYSLNDATDLSDFWFNNDNLEEPIGNAASILEEGAKLLQGKEVDTESIRRIARSMVKEYQSHYNVDTLSENLEKLFSYMQSQDKVSYDDMIRIMTEITMPVIEESTSVDETQQEIYQNFKKKLRGMNISLSQQQKEEVAHYYDSYENFRRKMFGTLPLSEKGMDLETQWFEISQMSNGILNPIVNEADQPLRLVEALEQMKPQVVNNFGADNHGVAMDMALRIYEEYFKTQHSAKVRSLEIKMRRDRVEWQNQERQKYKDGLLKIRNSELQRKYNQEAAEYRYKIKKTGSELVRWIEHPTHQKHVPQQLKGMVLEFLDCIDFVSHRAKEDSKTTLQWKAKMEAISKELFKERTEMEAGLESNGQLKNFLETLHPQFIQTLDEFLEESGEEQKISQMDKEQLKRLEFLIRTMKTAVVKANELHANTFYRYAADAGAKTLRELETRKKRSPQTKLGHNIGKTLSLEMAEPKTYFERLGEGATAIYKEIRKGMDKRIFLIREARQYMKEILKDVKPEELKTWVGDKATVHEVKTKDGNIKLTTGQIMSLYLLSKRNQGLFHILRGGIKPAEIGEGIKAIIQHDKAHVTPEQLKAILDLLTPEQKAFADKVQKFLAENCARWGNEVSMQLYEYERFLDKRYFPIKTVEDQHNDKGKQDNAGNAYAIKNFGFTKNIQVEAPQSIWVEDILDVFTDHVAKMASYNAYLIPLSDAMKWYNFNEAGFEGENFELKSVHGMIEEVYGQEANAYFKELLYEINGRETHKSKLEIADTLIRNFKKASVMAKLSVVVQQPTAYARAYVVLDAKDMISALDYMTSIKRMRENAEEAIQHSAIAQWKDWGFFESHISKSLKQVITGQQTLGEKIDDYASWGAQKADKYTWGMLWYACKKEIARTKPSLEIGTQEYFEAVTERFDEVIDETQVVDSILHKSPILKSKETYIKKRMAFKNEPLKSYNMLYRAADHLAREEATRFQKIQKAFLNKKFGRAATAYLLSNLLTSMAASLAYALRDDKEEPFGKRYVKRFQAKLMDNINPLGLIPFLSDIISILQGYEVESMDVKAIEDMINAGKNIYKRITKPDVSTYTWYGLAKKMTNALCALTGKPFYNVWSEVESIIENIGNFDMPEKETNGDLYEDLIWSEPGSKTYERAYKKLQKQKGKSAEDIKKGVRSKLNTMFKEGELTEEEAKDALRRFGYKDVSDIVKKWKENMEK